MRILIVICSLLLLTGCAPSGDSEVTETQPVSAPSTAPTAPAVPTTAPTESPVDPIEEMVNAMTVEERVGQLFLARCQDSTALNDISQYHLGGYVLFGEDFEGQTPDSLRAKLSGYQDAAAVPLLIAVDEEGGTVTRISRLPAFRSTPFPAPRDSYHSGGLEQMLAVEEEKCQLLTSLGINVNLGPVCDITTDPNAFMYRRSLGLDPDATGAAIASTVRLMNAYQLGSALKHFPGYGNNVDTHVGIAVDSRPLEALESCDLIPFRYGIQAHCGAIMVSHTIAEALDTQLPASLSPAVHGYLRDTMGFDGVLITDDLVMQAITDCYGAGEAAVLAVLAGNDLLCSTDYAVQYEAVLAAVADGRIPIDSLNTAVYRIIKWKADMNLF